MEGFMLNIKTIYGLFSFFKRVADLRVDKGDCRIQTICYFSKVIYTKVEQVGVR